MLTKKQLYLVLQMEHAGVDLEKESLTPDEAAYVVTRLAENLAKEACQFSTVWKIWTFLQGDGKYSDVLHF